MSKQGLTRGQKLFVRMRDQRDVGLLSLSRARLLTASYKETEGLPWSIRRAKGMERILTQIPIFIEEEQLLVGDFAAKPMWAEWYPEFDVRWVPKEIQDRTIAFEVPEEEVAEQMKICEYWENRCSGAAYLSSLSEKERKRFWETTEEGAFTYSAVTSIDRHNAGYWVVDYERAIKKGFLGVLAEVKEELQATVIKDDESFQKVNFLRALDIVYNAGIRYSERYAALARELAEKAEGKTREELNRIAEVCAWVPAHPARSFYEALQTMWFCHVIVHLETKPAGVSPGRIDQYLYPYYKRDVEEGRLTKEEAIELLECLRVKISSLRHYNIQYFRQATGGEAQFHNVTLGGQTPDGKDATNELSYLILEAALRTRTPHHTISIRYHNNLPIDFALKAVELAATGSGYPAFFGDDSNIAPVMDMGALLEEARTYAIGGCIVPMIAGQSGPLTPLFLNVAKILELALYNGFDPRTGKQIGPKTGKFEDFKTFNEFLDAYKEQFKQAAQEGLNTKNGLKAIREYMCQPIFYSGLTEGCIKSGRSATGDAPRYQFQHCNPIGIMNVVDSLAAIKKRVFEEDSIGKEELIAALKANFQGREDIQRLLLSAPKFGNDDDYVDSIATDLYQFWRKVVTEEMDSLYGRKCVAVAYSVSTHQPYGLRVGALPSGRGAWETLADGSVSPVQGVDTHGPTATINSCLKIDQYPVLSTLLNMKLLPDTVKTKEQKLKLLALIKTYFNNGGKHIQFNVVDRETLLDAQLHPERYRNLLVRVAGYSAFFTELARGVQDEIIARTTHSIG